MLSGLTTFSTCHKHDHILAGEPGLASFSSTLPLDTSSLTPSDHILVRKDGGEGKGVEGKYIP